MKRLAPLFLASILALSLLSACSSPDAEATTTVTHTNPVEASDEPALSLPPEEPSDTPALSLPPEEEPSETPEPSEEPSAQPAETPSPKPQPSTEPEPSLSVPSQEPVAEPSDEVCNLPLDPSDTAGVDLQAFYDDLVFDDPEFNANMALTGEYLDAYYPGLSGIAARQCVVYQPMMSAVVCEIALVEVEDAADVDAVKAIFQARIDAQVGTDDEPGLAWYPESIEGWRNSSRIVSQGNFVMMIAYDKCDNVTAAFEALF